MQKKKKKKKQLTSSIITIGYDNHSNSNTVTQKSRRTTSKIDWKRKKKKTPSIQSSGIQIKTHLKNNFPTTQQCSSNKQKRSQIRATERGQAKEAEASTNQSQKQEQKAGNFREEHQKQKREREDALVLEHEALLDGVHGSIRKSNSHGEGLKLERVCEGKMEKREVM